MRPLTSRPTLLKFRLSPYPHPPQCSGLGGSLTSSRVKWKRKSGCRREAPRGASFLSLGSACFKTRSWGCLWETGVTKAKVVLSVCFSVKRETKKDRGCCFLHVRVNFLPEPRWKLAVGFYTCPAAELEQPPVSFAHAGSHIAQKKLPGTFSLSQRKKNWKHTHMQTAGRAKIRNH